VAARCVSFSSFLTVDEANASAALGGSCLTGPVIRIEPLGNDRFAELAAILGTTSAAFRPLAEELAEEFATEPSYVQAIHLLAYESDRAVGYAAATNPRFDFLPRRFQVQVRVLPTHRHRGIGQSLAAELDGWLAGRDIEELVAQTDGQPEGERFAIARGFEEVERRYEQRLTPAVFDASTGASTCAAATTQCEAQGVRITTLADLRLTGRLEIERELYELDTSVMADEPTGLDGGALQYEDWCEQYLGGHDPAGVLIAMHTGQFVGLVVHWTETDSILVASTGVRSTWRGRGVAKALKLASVEYCRTVGLPLRTMNNAANEPILKLNALCGFERVATYTRWLRR
jgi:mycothiol synthase